MKIKCGVALGISACLAMGLAGGHAAAQDRMSRTVAPRPVMPCSVWVQDAAGHTLNTYYSRGRTYVLGERGERYSVRVRNRSSERVEAVVTVDGRDVINGQPGDYVAQRGYVIGAHDSVDIRGFRQSLEQVATFRFSSPRHSYSARMGTPENVGVIGVACFRERHSPVAIPAVPYRSRGPRAARGDSARDARPDKAAPTRKRQSGSDAAREYAPAPRSTHNLGTEYGESRYAPVSTTSFVREDTSHPQQVVTIHYDDADGLEARGIRVYWFPAPEPRYAPPPPDPFPDSRFAPPPP